MTPTIDRYNSRFDTDEALLRRISTGDESALNLIFDRYADRLFSYILGIVENEAVAQDVLQECLITIWKKADTFREDGRVIAWLYSIAHNKSMRTFREKRTISLDLLRKEPLSTNKKPTEKLEAQQLGDLIKEQLSSLSRAHRVVIELVFLHGLSMQEVAQICSIPLGTVKSRLKYAKSQLKNAFVLQGFDLEDLL